MSYRGEDLDLRTPQARGARDGSPSADLALNGTRPRTPNGGNGRTETVYVDETVLACCNHAYDIALAHGASEVRLEHLVHALTRVEAAAEILEQRGIREAHLRRESAAVIASEIPVGLSHSHSAPRTSVELEDVLRRASDLARGRGVTAAVHDLLWILLNYDREIPAIALLLRHAADWQSWDWPHQADQRREPPRQAYYPERRTFSEAPPPPRPRAIEAAPAPTYTQAVNLDPVHGRLDQMDSALRKMQSDMAADRRAMTDLLRDIQRDLSSGRGASGATPTVVIDRLQGIEDIVEGRFQDFNRTASALTDRMQGLERSVTGGIQEGARNWAALGDRLKTFDKSGSHGANSGLADLVTEQLIAVTAQVQAATDKLQALERNFEARHADGQRVATATVEKLRSVENALSGGRGDDGALHATVTERFQGMSQQLEQHGLTTASMVAQLTEPVVDRLRQLEDLLQQRQGDNGHGDRAMLERLSRIEQVLSSEQQTGVRISETAAAIDRRMQSMEAQTGTSMKSAQTLVTQLAQVEQLIQSHGDRGVQYTQQLAQQSANTHAQQLADVHEAIVKLGSNQQALSENLDQWRTESEGGISIVSNKLGLMEAASAAPTQLLKQMQVDLEGLQRVTIADYDQNRKGIRHWLFGTDELFAGSWRDETKQIRDRLRLMREERKA
jgi:Clp amino terminal domain, pathogenicity island component